VTAPVWGVLYNSSSCSRVVHHGLEELSNGGDIVSGVIVECYRDKDAFRCSEEWRRM
jgi:hypothetical protein